MYLLQYQKLYDKLESLLIAHKLIGNLVLSDIYVVKQEYACDGKPGFNIFIDDFKWELSEVPNEWTKVILSSVRITSKSASIIKKSLTEKQIEYEYEFKNGIQHVFRITHADLNDSEIETIMEITDLYLTLKNQFTS